MILRCLIYILLILSFLFPKIFAGDYSYILNDKCIYENYVMARRFFDDGEIDVYRTAVGTVITFEFDDIMQEYLMLSDSMLAKLRKIEKFLAKYKNPVIIEVHTEKNTNESFINYKNWELSIIVANRIEEYFVNIARVVLSDKISSIGYGEFVPQKNTSNNGGKCSNRVDIILPCSISGE